MVSRCCRWLCATAVGAALLGPGFPRAAEAHDLHTTLAEVTVDPHRRAIRALIRVFADDFGKASLGYARRTARARQSGDDAAAMAYVQSAFQLIGGDGKVLPLRSCGTRRSGDLLWICVEASAPANAAGLRLRDAMLCDLFADEVNIVRATLAGATRSALFTRGDGAKPIG